MNYIEVYQKHIQTLKRTADKNEWRGCCPLPNHKDDKPSFFVNESTGQFFCFGCSRSGNVYTFLELIGDFSSRNEIVQNITIQSVSPTFAEPINEIIPKQLHRNLLNDYEKLQYILRERRVSFFVIKKYLIGYDPESDRYSFPIRSLSGKFLNIKLHNSYKDPKSISWKSGSGTPRLFPVDATLKSEIVITEGEFDTLALHSLGINAVTSTAGAGTFLSEWGWLFRERNVKILYDSDNAGNEGGNMVASILREYARKVEIIRFPDFPDKKKVDVTDFLRANGNIFKLLKIERKH